jgi:recombination protein RecT
MEETSNKIVSKKKEAPTLKSITDSTITQIMKYTEEKRLNLPADYSAPNAINALKLMIVDDDKLKGCTLPSIANAMLNMCILGLNPAKKQCYPIAYGNKMGLMVSYFGNKLLAMRADPNIKDIIAEVVKEGEIFEFDHDVDGNYKILNHKKTLESIDSDKYVAGYATIFYKDGREPKSIIMTWKQILQAWKKSPAKPFLEDGSLKPSSVHAQYTDDMIKRTLTNAITKGIRNSSDDASLFNEALDAVELDEKQAESQEIVESKTSSEEIVDIDYSVIDEETGEVEEPKYVVPEE